MGVKVAEFVARELQGVTDQASLDQARERIRQVHPQAAAQVPQMYSKEAVRVRAAAGDCRGAAGHGCACLGEGTSRGRENTVPAQTV